MNKELTSFIPSELSVAKVKKGIFIHLTLLHCAGDVKSPQVITLPLSEKGKETLELFIAIIDDVANFMMENPEESSDFIAKKVVEKHSFDYKQVYELIKKFSICDSGTECFAEPYEYFVEFNDGTGEVIRTEVKNIDSNF